MRSFRVLILASTMLATPALAQEMYPGQSVVVNPNAVQQMQQPSAPLPPVYLHMPVHRRAPRKHRAQQVADDTTTTDDSATIMGGSGPHATYTTAPPEHHHKQAAPVPDIAADQMPPPVAPPRKAAPPVTTASVAPANDGGIPLSFGGPIPTPPVKAAPAKAAPPPAAKVVTPPPPAKLASVEPPPAHTPTAAPQPGKAGEPGLTRHGEIRFNPDATDPAPSQYDGLKTLASDLNAAIQAGATRVQLDAFGGAPGDKGSDARRLSLKRALAVRQVLIDDGVPSSKIDVRAMGGIDDNGKPDRVDVFTRGG